MIHNAPYSLVARGLIRGARCGISGVEFVKCDPTKAEFNELIEQAKAHALSVMYSQDGDELKNRSLNDRKSLYQRSQQQ
jgi:hypothetical protein